MKNHKNQILGGCVSYWIVDKVHILQQFSLISEKHKRIWC